MGKHEAFHLQLGTNVYFVMAGDIFVGRSPETVKTTLGSCIALTAWHPQLKLGGMCHYLLHKPSRQERSKLANYYGENALSDMENRLQKHAPLNEYKFGLYGGGSLFFKEFEGEGIAQANIDHAMNWLNTKKLSLQSYSIGGCECRTISLCLQSGEITLKVYSHYRHN